MGFHTFFQQDYDDKILNILGDELVLIDPSDDSEVALMGEFWFEDEPEKLGDLASLTVPMATFNADDVVGVRTGWKIRHHSITYTVIRPLYKDVDKKTFILEEVL